ncbi:MAG: ATP-grasp fold amidoligase family protein [Eubacteriales bacterium]|nr:ATP-grasp fold amidoligase family protein [Eubacteriales bacterium]
MQIGRYIKAIKKYIFSGGYRFLVNSGYGKYDDMPDAEYLSRKFSVIFGYRLPLEAPHTFNEKLQWLKLYDRKPEYTVMVDKYKARDYISEKIGAQYLIPLLGVWDAPDEIDFSLLPDKFVLKCNHNSGRGMCICKDKSALNIKKVKTDLKRGLSQDYYLTGREWPYKDVPRKIIAEQFMKSDAGGLTDYKIHCFNGEPKLILVCKDRFTQTGLTEDFFSPQWEHLDIRRPTHPNSLTEIAKPEELSEILALAKKLSEGIPFLRVDFYIIHHKVYFSELTFYPASGFEKFVPEQWDDTLGSWLELPSHPANQ